MFIDKYLERKSQRKYIFAVFLVLFIYYPYVFVDFIYPSFPSTLTIQMLIGLGFCGLNILAPCKRPIPWTFILCILIMSGGCFIQYKYSGSDYYWQKIAMVFTASNLIIFLYYKVCLFEFFRIYNRWLYVMAIGGIIAALLGLLGIQPFLHTVSLNDGRTLSTWGFTCIKEGDYIGRIVRYCGFFDEPGAFAYWAMFGIAINKLFVGDKKIEWPFMILTFFTYSMGFIAQAGAYYLLFGFKNIQFGKKFAILSLAIASFFVLSSTKDTAYSGVYDATIGRFERLQNAQSFLGGTNREWLMEKAYDAWQEEPVWGQCKNLGQLEYMGDNVYENLAHDGIVGCVYLYFPYALLLLLGIIRRDYDVIGVTIFCALAVLHRPLHANLLTFFIYYSIPFMYGLKMHGENIKELPK